MTEILKAAIERGASDIHIKAGDVARARLKQVSRKGLTSLEKHDMVRLALDRPLGKALNDALIETLYDSHCKLVPRAAMTAMAGVQRLRDAVLAENVRKAASLDGAVLIAGNGHVRNDRAVPWYLAQTLPGKKVLTVMLLEVGDRAQDPHDLIPVDPDGKPAADFFWFTPRAEREDPCESLRKRFGK